MTKIVTIPSVLAISFEIFTIFFDHLQLLLFKSEVDVNQSKPTMWKKNNVLNKRKGRLIYERDTFNRFIICSIIFHAKRTNAHKPNRNDEKKKQKQTTNSWDHFIYDYLCDKTNFMVPIKVNLSLEKKSVAIYQMTTFLNCWTCLSGQKFAI